MSDAPTWLNTDSAAAYLGITPATLHRLVRKGPRGRPPHQPREVGSARRTVDRFLEGARIVPVGNLSRHGQADDR